MTPEPWESYLPWRAAFHAMLDQRFYTPDWLDGEIATGRFVLFANENAAIIASIKRYPTGLFEVQGEAATGNLADIARDLIPSAEAWARSIGCKSAAIQSRPGWGRVMKDYSLYQTTIRKSL